MNALLAFPIAVGAFVIAGLRATGRLTLFAGQALWRTLLPPYYPARLLEQMEQSGLVSAMQSNGNRDILVPLSNVE